MDNAFWNRIGGMVMEYQRLEFSNYRMHHHIKCFTFRNTSHYIDVKGQRIKQASTGSLVQ